MLLKSVSRMAERRIWHGGSFGQGAAAPLTAQTKTAAPCGAAVPFEPADTPPIQVALRGGLHLFSRDREAVRNRLENVASELQHGFAVLRGFRDQRIEGAAGILALQLEELGRGLDRRKALHRRGGVLEVLASGLGSALAQRLGSLGGDLRRLDERF